MVLVTLLLAVCLSRVQYLVSRGNMKARFNGFGAIPTVQDKTADAPMVYRVLVPWLLGKRATVATYNALQAILMWGALYSLFLAWGTPVMLLCAVLFTVTFYFDYWDWTAEIIGFSLALVSLPLAILGVVIHGLSRETAPLCGLVFALRFMDPAGGAVIALTGLAVLLIVRMVQGEHKLYCKRWMWQENLAMLQGGQVITGKWSIYYSLGLCGLAAAGSTGRLDGLIVPVLTMAGWGMAKANETRVFAALVPYAASFLWLLM